MAVFTPVTLEEARAFLVAYDVGDVRALDPIAEGVENTNFRVDTDAGRFVLTLFEKRVDPADLPFFMTLTTHYANEGLPVPLPRKTKVGQALGALNARPAALIEWKEGAWKREPSVEDQRRAGVVLAQLHARAPSNIGERDNAFGPAGWRAIFNACANAARADHGHLVADLDQELTALDAAWPAVTAALPAGVIHGDYFPDNVLWRGDAISGVIDFYFAAKDVIAYDLAVALLAWGFDLDGRERPGALGAFRAGYESVRPLNDAEAEAMPVLLRGAATRFTLSRLHDLVHHDPAWVVTPKDPYAFHRRLVAVRDGAAAVA